METEWNSATVGDAFDLVNGFAFKSKDFLEAGVPVIKIKNVKAGFFSEHNFSYVDPQFLNSRKDKVAKFDDLLISMSGNRHDGSPETWVGKVALFRKPDPYLINQRVGALRVKDRHCFDPRFMSYLLASWTYQAMFISVATSSGGQANLSPAQILSAPIDFPDIETQKAIAHILGTLDDKIELNRQMNATLEAMAQALFKSWFVDFDPAIDNALAAGNPIPEPLHARADKRAGQRVWTPDEGARRASATDGASQPRKALGDQRKTLPEAIQKQFPNRFVFNEDMGWVPEGWEVSTVGEEVETTGGGTPSTKDATYWEDGIHAFCTPKDMSMLGSIILMDTERHLTAAGVNKISSGQLPQGVVLMSSRAPIGYLAISDVPVSVNQGIIAMLPNANFGSMYLLSWAHFNMSAIKDRANGSTFMEISKKNFRPIPFLFPNGEIAGFFNKQAQGVYDKLLLVSEQIRELSTIRDTLLPKLLAGQLRIPDAEKRVTKAI